jgi:exosortase D (VPLPA-CTERM-specific)
MESSQNNSKNLSQITLVVTAIAILYAFVLAKLGNDWWIDENYSHGLLVPFLIGYIIWLDFDLLKKTPRKSSFWIGGSVVMIALAMLFAGTLGVELFMQRISLVVMLAGIIIYYFGANLLRFLSVPFFLLIFAIPIPQIIFNKIAFPLQVYASQFAIWGIRLFEVPSVRKGNVIEILPRGATQIVSLEVVEACSGIRSLMTLVTLALVLAYFTREKSQIGRPFYKNFNFWQSIVLVIAAVPIAILTNAGRVTATGVLTYLYGKKMLDGFFHDISGWLVYIVALILLALVGFLFKKFARRKRVENNEIVSPNFVTTVISSWKKTLVLIALLLVSGIFINWFESRGEVEITRLSMKEIPATLGDWKQRGADIRFSEQTESVLRTTDYLMREYQSSSGMIANLYVGYYASQKSGATYHSPQNCLPGSGWEMIEPELVEIKLANGKTFSANRYIIVNDTKREIMLYWYQGRGRSVASEYSDKIFTVFDSFTRQRSDGSMVRILIPSGNSDSEATKQAINLSSQISDNLASFVPE